jgi:hypothetical protein
MEPCDKNCCSTLAKGMSCKHGHVIFVGLKGIGQGLLGNLFFDLGKEKN